MCVWVKVRVSPAGWVAPVTPGRVLFEVEGVSFDIAKEALRLAAQKLPVKDKVLLLDVISIKTLKKDED